MFYNMMFYEYVGRGSRFYRINFLGIAESCLDKLYHRWEAGKVGLNQQEGGEDQ